VKRTPLTQLSRRERQIMEIIYRLGQASASEVHDNLSNAPSYSTVRALLRVLVDKGCLRHHQDGAKYIYAPTVARDKARQSALRNLVQTFFDGSAEQAVATLLSMNDSRLSEDDLDRLSQLIEQARKEGR
jgi:BlaI family penicillinase repressor